MQWPESSSSTGGFEHPDPGSYAAKFSRIVDQGTQTDELNGEVKIRREVMITWELAEKMTDGRPFVVSAWYSQSLHEKANLRKMLDGLNGGTLKAEQVKNFSLPGAPKALLGLNCMVTLMLGKTGKIKVASVAKRPPAMPPAEGVNEKLYLSLDEADFDKATFAKLGESTRKKIARSPEFTLLLRDDPSLAGLIVQAKDANATTQADGAKAKADDDIPF